jgi:hypothetical protein
MLTLITETAPPTVIPVADAPIRRNTARYCDGKIREFTARLLDFDGTTYGYAAVAGQTCSDPLDCVALTEDEARLAGTQWAMTRTRAFDVSPLFEVIPLPVGWRND